MNETRVTCPSCQTEFMLRPHKKTRWIAAGAAALLGGAVTESLLGGVLIGGLTFVIASKLDEQQAHRCPACHRVSLGLGEDSRAAYVGEAQPSTAHH